MIPLARKFFRRSSADRRLLARAFGVHACVASLLRLAGFRRLSRWLAAGKVDRAGVRRGIDDAAIERVVWAVRQAAAVCAVGPHVPDGGADGGRPAAARRVRDARCGTAWRRRAPAASTRTRGWNTTAP